MARQVEGPWYRASKGTWYATVQGRNVNLRVRGESNRQEAVKAWHRLMAGVEPQEAKAQKEEKPRQEPKAQKEPTVKAVADSFLLSKRGTIKQQTHAVYGYLLKHVVDAFGTMPAESLKAPAVSRWLSTLMVGEGEEAKPASPNTRHDVATLLASCLKWAEAEGTIGLNPLKGLRRPARQSRGAKAVVSEEAHGKLLRASAPGLRLLLQLLHETGARPSELAKLEARHIDFPNGVAVLAEHKTAHSTGKPRLIALTPKAAQLHRAQAEAHPEGPLLRNSKGQPWHKGTCSK